MVVRHDSWGKAMRPSKGRQHDTTSGSSHQIWATQQLTNYGSKARLLRQSNATPLQALATKSEQHNILFLSLSLSEYYPHQIWAFNDILKMQKKKKKKKKMKKKSRVQSQPNIIWGQRQNIYMRPFICKYWLNKID